MENHYTKYISYIAQCIYTHGRWTPPPKSIENRCLEYCYIKLGRSTGGCNPLQSSIDALNKSTPTLTDLMTDLPPSQLIIGALNTTTPNLADLMTDILADLPPCSIKHRCLEYHYTKLGRSTGRSTHPLPHQSTIDAWETATPNLEDLLADLDIYSTMHIYLWQIDPPPIEHRSQQNHYTK